MTLPVPAYLERSGVQDRNLRFSWDDNRYERAYTPLDKAARARLERLSQRAILAFAIACAEWLFHRFRPVSIPAFLDDYIEAAWAAVVDARYANYYLEPRGDEWQGPDRKPLAVALMLLVDTIVRVENDDHPDIGALSLANLAAHVMTDPKPFQEWRERVMSRLERLYPLNPRDTRGEPVPREALDPDFDLQPEMAPVLVGSFLGRLDPKANPFLRTPEEMRNLFFEGVPYKLP
ncbi:hypothetical protein [Myxococcus sp. RHSTA-1-4]|uniref:hypothetical protein n=1 Tax=Myxococcus sp. RHSTA-1-4 TaxID=2874601 RepID=UPI001CBED3F3|nr:hypothetical protein [Myxococcus sp. RHSTA-1-4]MBZ4418139.1 hypothetical protein [Myxococcus sp. RHSTA-1-4]